MKRMVLYSTSRSSRPSGERARGASPPPVEVPAEPPGRRSGRWRSSYQRFERYLLIAAGGLFALLLVFIHAVLAPAQRPVDQEDIDAAVLRTLETKPLPSSAARAYAVIRPSVVRVRGLGNDESEVPDAAQVAGTGVVIVGSGLILTNLHVVAAARRLGVLFANGFESEAEVVEVRPEQDLAVVQAKTLPDDLVAATMRSTRDLRMGDEVIAVGFPFGIGPSVSAGVVSGLRREYRSPEGERLLSNLIQFDAAVNPGSSGGPLVTAEGEVVGIVTGILNPSEQRVFIGIGFAVPIETAAAAAGLHPF